MSSTAKAHEPTMEEILASIRRIIADDEPAEETKPAPEPEARKPEPPEPAKTAASAPAETELNQDDIDAMLASFDAPPVPGKEDEAKEEDVLELRKPIAKSAEATRSDVVFRDAIDEAKAEASEEMSGWDIDEEPAGAAQPPAKHEPEEGLLAPEASAAVANAFSSLANTILSQNARTLDDLVQEMLRPMLKSWLDDNLPAIVERLVRAEIERVSRGPRR